MSVNDLAIDLGAKPEEVAAQVKIPVLVAPREYQYVPLAEDSNSLCIGCLDKATFKQVLVYTNPITKVELEDSNFYLLYCTPCRDKEIARLERKARPKTSPYPDERYHRFAGYSKHMPSLTQQQMKELKEKVEKEIEQSRRDASGQHEGVGESSPAPTGTDEHANQATSG